MKTTLQAFTLLEMLVVLSLTSILLALSVPALQSSFAHHRDILLRDRLKNILETAHQEANIGTVAVCRSTMNRSCEEKGDNWLVFFDEKDNGMLTDKDRLISVHHLDVKEGALVLRSFPSYRHYLRFSGGDIVHADNATITYYKNKKLVWSLVVNQAGRVRIG